MESIILSFNVSLADNKSSLNAVVAISQGAGPAFDLSLLSRFTTIIPIKFAIPFFISISMDRFVKQICLFSLLVILGEVVSLGNL